MHSSYASSPATVTIVGAGLSGLVAAIAAAEAGAQVVIHEAGRQPGGRARSSDGEWRANYGPHALYGDGPLIPWLRERRLAPQLLRPPLAGFRVRSGGRLRRAPLPLLRAATTLTRKAPIDDSFAEWAGRQARPPVVHAALGLASLPTFHADPGELSAAFVAERLRRVTQRGTSIRYVSGGWSALVARLAQRADDLGVDLRLSSHLSELPQPPVIVATSRASAARLLGRNLPAPNGTRVALLDVGLASPPRLGPFAVLDLDERTYLARYTAVDPQLAPDKGELIQCSAPVRSGEDHDEAIVRLEASLDQLRPGWRSATRWRRTASAVDSTGAVDPPGTTWRDRPAIHQGDGIFLAGDYVAAPGMLGEVSWASAIQAAGLATTPGYNTEQPDHGS